MATKESSAVFSGKNWGGYCQITYTAGNGSISITGMSFKATNSTSASYGAFYDNQQNITVYAGSKSASATLKNVRVNSTSYQNATFSGVSFSGLSGTTSVSFTCRARSSDPYNLTFSYSIDAGSSVVVPTVTGLSVSAVSETSLQASFTISSNGGATATGHITCNGVTKTGTSATFTGLTANKSYTVTAYASNSAGSSTTLSKSGTTWAYPSVTSAPNFTIGGTVNIPLSNTHSRNTSVAIKYGSTTIRTISTSTGTASYDSSLDSSTWYQKIPSDPSGTYTAVATYSGNTTAAKTGTFSANKTNCTPTFSDFTWADINTTTAHLTKGSTYSTSDIIVKGYSNVQVTISAANKATLKNYVSENGSKYVFTCGSKTSSDPMPYSSSSPVTGTIDKVDSNAFQVYAVDARNYPSATVTKTASNYLQYEPLGKTTASVSRVGKVNEQTTLSFSGTIWNNSFGAVTNSIKTADYKYKTEDSGWSATTDIKSSITISGNTFSFNSNIAGDTANGFDVTNVYTIRVTIADELSSIYWDLTLNAGTPHVAYYKKGIAIMGQYDEGRSDALQVNGAELVSGQIVSLSNIGAEGYIRTNDGLGIYRSTAPYINFHYGNASSSTSRIYESASGELTHNARLKMNADQYWTTASSKCIDMSNSDIGKLNAIYFNDECTGTEGINFLKQNATSGSTTSSDYETLRGYRGSLYYNGSAMAPLSRTASSGSGYVRIPTSASGGIQICWGSKTVTTAVSGSWGSIYGSSNVDPSITFAQAFSATPNVTISKSSQSNTPSAFIGDVKWNKTGITSIQFWRGTSSSSAKFDLSYIAIGTY